MTAPASIDGVTLTRTAFDILTADLEGYGNTLSPMHRAALLELLDTMTGYATGHHGGRRAFPLPTGMGKTSAVVAFIAALHRLGYVVPVSVAASKVEALCALKRDLLAHGVPAGVIGLKHSMPDASEPSTGNESRPVQLVTHARIRSGRDFELFGHHEGTARPLCIYDETLMRADAFAFSARSLFAATAALAALTEGRTDPAVRELVGYLQESCGRLRAALERLRAGGDPHSNGAAVEVPAVGLDAVASFREVLAREGRALRGLASELRDFVDLSQDSLRVVGSEQGDGIVTAREAVPPELRNVVILDASAPIRELARLDPTITVVQSFDPADLKSFERVEVRQLLSPGGRSSIGHSLRADRQEVSAVAREVADIIREGWGTEAAFLVFTFVGKTEADPLRELKQDLRRSGVDLQAVTPEGRPRVNFLTWGSETSLNGLEHCTHVIMAGVLHRSHLDLSAAVRGQSGNPAEPTPSARIRELVESEIAHVVYQGASRGSCRRVDQGKAAPMRLTFIHRSPGIRTILDRVMPGAVWRYPEPKHLKKATADSKAAQLLARLLAHLRTLPESIEKISSRALKEAMGLGTDKPMHHAFTRAVGLLDIDSHGWRLEGRSLVRGSAAYGFHPES